MVEACWDYKPLCPKGHELSWKRTYKPNCGKCGQPFSMSRWCCNTCDEAFCIKCYKPPLYGDKCPLGHQLIKTKLYSNTCDCCRKSIKGEAYRDSACDFDLCLECRIEFLRED